MTKKHALYSFVLLIYLSIVLSLAACRPTSGEDATPAATSSEPTAGSTQVAQATATTTSAPTATMTPEPAATMTPEPTVTMTAEPTGEAGVALESGEITISPSSLQEGGWVAIDDSQSVSIQWVGAPTDQIIRADFYLAPTGTGTYDARQLIGSDMAPEDGISINWQVPPGGFTAHLWAEGYDAEELLIANSPLLQVYSDAAPGPGTEPTVEPGSPTAGAVITPLNIDGLETQYGLPLPAQITGMAWSPDNKTLAVATTNGVALFDTLAQTQSDVAALGFSTSRMQFSPDGRYLLLMPYDPDSDPILWDLATGMEAETFAGKLEGVTGSTFSPDGQWLVTGTEGGALIIRDLASGTAEETIDLFEQGIGPGGQRPRVNNLAYLPDGRTVIIEVGGQWIEWVLWDMVDGRLLGTVSPEGHIAGPVASPFFAAADWQHIYWLSRGSIIKVDIETDEELGAYRHQDFVAALAFSPSGLLLATVSSQIAGDAAVPIITLWDLDQGQPARVLQDLVNMPVALAFSPDGTHLAYGTSGEGVTVLGIGQAP